MFIRTFALLAAAGAVALLPSSGAVSAAPPASAFDAQFRSGTLTVPLYVTVTDRESRLITDLERDDFEVYDNGQLQKLTLFDNKHTPITVIVMLDTSGSMTLILNRVKAAAEQFLLRLMPEDTGRVGAFNDKIEFHPEDAFTSDRDLLIRSLKELDFGYPTRLWDAVDESIGRLDGVQERKVVLVFTDGTDTASRDAKLGDVMDRARAGEVMVYSIGLETEIFNGQRRERSSPDRGLKRLSEETGGGFFLLKKEDELGPTFTRVAQELHSQYVLGFTPSNLDGKVHKLEVKVKKPGANPRARKSYVASKPETGSR